MNPSSHRAAALWILLAMATGVMAAPGEAATTQVTPDVKATLNKSTSTRAGTLGCYEATNSCDGSR